jgi:hypothetical protein
MDHTEIWTMNHKTIELIVCHCPKLEGLAIQLELRALPALESNAFNHRFKFVDLLHSPDGQC